MATAQDPNQPGGWPPQDACPGQDPYPPAGQFEPSDQPLFGQPQSGQPLLEQPAYQDPNQGQYQNPYQAPYQGPDQQQGYQQPYPPRYQGGYQGPPQTPPYFGPPTPPPGGGKSNRAPILIVVAVLVLCLGIGGYFVTAGNGNGKPGSTSGSATLPAGPAPVATPSAPLPGQTAAAPPSVAATIAETHNMGTVVPPSGAVGTDQLAIPYGTNPSAKVVLTIYEDLRCSFCANAEAADTPVYQPMADSGQIEVQYHLVDLVDQTDRGSTGSLDAGNALACAQDAGKFTGYHTLLFADQPDETSDLYGSAAELIALAKQVPGLGSPTFEACVISGRHDGWVAKNYTSLISVLGASAYVPYYAINGKEFTSPTGSGSDLRTALQAAISGS
ncbi:MAG TPA: thioredoxin domain-containing protein [Actinocrinis sp.]|nr:thioredoxin domain-containing protein [Actinocrinis sp.]